MQYKQEKVPLVILAGREYGTGSSRDWAAKGPLLQGVRAVIAESFERIHRSNLVGMGIAPLEFLAGESAVTLGLTAQAAFLVDDHQTVSPAADDPARAGAPRDRVDAAPVHLGQHCTAHPLSLGRVTAQDAGHRANRSPARPLSPCPHAHRQVI